MVPEEGVARISLGGVDIGLPAASPADALLKVGLFLLFVGAGKVWRAIRDKNGQEWEETLTL